MIRDNPMIRDNVISTGPLVLGIISAAGIFTIPI